MTLFLAISTVSAIIFGAGYYAGRLSHPSQCESDVGRAQFAAYCYRTALQGLLPLLDTLYDGDAVAARVAASEGDDMTAEDLVREATLR